MLLLLIVSLVLAQACSAKKEICITPTISGSSVSIAVSFKSLTKNYIAFGFGGTGMSKSEIVVFTKGTSYQATGYYASGEVQPKKNSVIWKLGDVKEASGQVTLNITRSIAASGTQSNAFPDGGEFIWATGAINNGEIVKHEDGANGSFSVETAKTSPATILRSESIILGLTAMLTF